MTNTSQVHSAIQSAYSGHLITVEGDKNNGLPGIDIVGMPSKTISESKLRIRSAISNSGFQINKSHYIINLAPAEIQKTGTGLDLPIALVILRLSKQLLARDLANSMFAGELSLDGEIKPIRGILNIIETAIRHGFKRIYIPAANASQAAFLSSKIYILPVPNLRALWLHLKKIELISPLKNIVKNTETPTEENIFDQISGQDKAKRALIIALAGRHNILLSGPPGSGKTMLASASRFLLPPLSIDDQISATKIHSITSNITKPITSRPFRAPHHTASATTIIGGGPHLNPGEISLAHTGVLFMDEFPEYRRDVLEALREPLESQTITVSYSGKSAHYPADFMLIAAMNPCHCGYLGSDRKPCTCTTHQLSTYRRKLSGPLLDRIDMFIEMRTEPTSVLFKNTTSSTITTQSANALISTARKHMNNCFNGRLSSAQITKLTELSPEARRILDDATNRLQLSARSYFKTLKVAKTIANLADMDLILPIHVTEALRYRFTLP